MKRVLVPLLIGALAVTGLTACMSDDDSSARSERRAAALTDPTPSAGGGYLLTIPTLIPGNLAADLTSYNWGVKRPGANGAPPTGAPQFGHLNVTKHLDESSPLFAKAAALGTPYPSAVLKLYESDGQGGTRVYATYELSNAVIAEIQQSGSGAGTPAESISIHYAKLKTSVTPYNQAGTAGRTESFGWDVAKNAPF